MSNFKEGLSNNASHPQIQKLFVQHPAPLRVRFQHTQMQRQKSPMHVLFEKAPKPQSEEQQQPTRAFVTPVLPIATQRATEPPAETHPPTTQVHLSKVIIPQLFAALKALMSAIPSGSGLPEVAVIMALEPLLAASCSLPGVPFTIWKQ